MLLKAPDITQFESIQKTKLTAGFIMNTIYETEIRQKYSNNFAKP